MSGDVLRRDASRSLGECILVSRLLLGSEFVLGMSIEIGAIATEREQEQKLSVHARGGNVGGGEALNCGMQIVGEAHSSISPQTRRDQDKLLPYTTVAPSPFKFSA